MLETKTGRIPITDQVKIIAGTSDVLPSPTNFEDLPSDWQKWAAVKPEMYAICAVLGNDVINKTLEVLAGSQTDLIPAIQKPDRMGMINVFDNLRTYVTDALHATLKDAPSERGRQKLWERYDQLDNLLQAIRGRPRVKNSTLTAGLNTAAKLMTGILQVIAYQGGRFGYNTDPQQLAQIADNSYPLIAGLAMLEIRDFSDKSHWLVSDLEENYSEEFNPDKFELKQTKNGLGLFMEEEAFGQSTPNPEEPHIGCPGMVKVDEASPIRKLWSWFVKIAPQVYKTYYETLDIKPDYSKMKIGSTEDIYKEIKKSLEQEE